MVHFIVDLDECRWPSGDYSILMAKYGCPDPDINNWKYGYVKVSFYSRYRRTSLAYMRLLHIDVKVWLF